MIKTILVPLDGSQSAEHAIAPACRVARETEAELVLMQAVRQARGRLWDERRHEVAAIGEARHYLETVRSRLEETGLRVRAQVLPGPSAQAIIFAAHAAGADLICMATHGATGVQRALLGSVTEEVVRRTNLPVLLTRAAPIGDEAAPYATIVVGMDGTPIAEAALDYLTGAGFGQAAQVVLLQAVAPAQVEPLPMMVSGADDHRIYAQVEQATEARRRAAEEYLRSVAGMRLRDRVWRTRVSLDDPARALMEAARLEHADLIVVTTHEHHTVERLRSGGVAMALLRHVEAPLLILRGKDLAAMGTVADGAESQAKPDKDAGEPIARGQISYPVAGSAQ